MTSTTPRLRLAWPRGLRAALAGALATLCALGLTAPAHAEFPEKPITLIVPFVPGGPIDKSARLLAQALSKQLGHATVLVDYQPGSGGTVGTAYVAHAPKDGYTLLMHHVGLATAPSLWRRLSYDPMQDLAYLGVVLETPMTLIGRPSLLENSYEELLQLIRKKRNGLTLANAGAGSASHMCGLLLQSRLKVQLSTIPYRGSGPALNDLLGGRVDLMCDQSITTAAQIEAGRVKAYAVTTAERVPIPSLSHLPTLNELGLPGFDVAIWYGLYAPAGTPEPVLKKLNTALQAAIKDPTFVQAHQATGTRIVTGERTTPQGHKKFVAAEMARLAPIIKGAGQYAN